MIMRISRKSEKAGSAIIATIGFALALCLGSLTASAEGLGQGASGEVQAPTGPTSVGLPADSAVPPAAEVPLDPPRLAVDPADDAALRERVDARWRALIAGDFPAAYEFALPSYRERTPYATYRSQFGSALAWHVATITQVEYDSDDVARVRVAVDHSFLPSAGGAPIRSVSWLGETWLRREGQWWHSGPR